MKKVNKDNQTVGTLAIGTIVKFTTFSKNKDIIQGPVIRLYIGTQDKKQYCTVLVDGKKYSKQINKIEVIV